MILKKWEDLPQFMQVEEVKKYYKILQKKRISLFLKRYFDVIGSLFLLVILAPVFLILAITIKLDSKGPVFYRQTRVTQYGRRFRIHKFRSMVDRAGTLVTVNDDSRITKVGRFIRDKRLDEIPQLIDVLQGNMSFVGARPEVVKYVETYTPEMWATLLLPAGITSEASIQYKDEAKLLDRVKDVDRVYIEQVLPEKMKYNLEMIREFGFWSDIKVIFQTGIILFLRKCG